MHYFLICISTATPFHGADLLRPLSVGCRMLMYLLHVIHHTAFHNEISSSLAFPLFCLASFISASSPPQIAIPYHLYQFLSCMHAIFYSEDLSELFCALNILSLQYVYHLLSVTVRYVQFSSFVQGRGIMILAGRLWVRISITLEYFFLCIYSAASVV
jgi:hypothetical protein